MKVISSESISDNYLLTLVSDSGDELTVAVPMEGSPQGKRIWGWGETVYLNLVFGNHYE